MIEGDAENIGHDKSIFISTTYTLTGPDNFSVAHAELVPCFDSFLTVTVTQDFYRQIDIDIDIVSHPQPQERLTSSS